MLNLNASFELSNVIFKYSILRFFELIINGILIIFAFSPISETLLDIFIEIIFKLSTIMQVDVVVFRLLLTKQTSKII